MKILAIETSCDDTGVAILDVTDTATTVLANIVSSQPIHENYGGVFPMMAKREHQRNLLPVLQKALQESALLNPKSQLAKDPQPQSGQNENSKYEIIEKILDREPELAQQLIPFLKTHEKPAIDAIAITYGPGLEPCLWVGVNCARALSVAWDLPLIPVNHIEGHIIINFMNKINENPKSETLNSKQIQSSNLLNLKKYFPAIALVVSGGHTQLIHMKDIGSYEIIGETRDDAAGECFDKCARLLHLGYPGGPIISRIAKTAQKSDLSLPRPMINSQDYDFSFSGLKTAILYETQNKNLTPDYVKNVCFEVEEAIIDVLLKKTFQAIQKYQAKSIILGGGVSANTKLRETFRQKLASENTDIALLIPPRELSTDNALMIAVTAFFHHKKTASWETLEAYGNARVGE